MEVPQMTSVSAYVSPDGCLEKSLPEGLVIGSQLDDLDRAELLTVLKTKPVFHVEE